MLRYPDPVEEIDEEISSRRQRGLNKTREQRQVLAMLERAREVVANPPENLQRAVTADEGWRTRPRRS